jgi:hypothetical protein
VIIDLDGALDLSATVALDKNEVALTCTARSTTRVTSKEKRSS